MFDAETARLIRAAPAFGDIEADKLPQELTSVYAELVAMRLQGVISSRNDTRWLERLGRLRRIAAFYEAVVDTGPGDDARRAAAFVSASAYQLLGQQIAEADVVPASLLDAGSIHPVVAAPLLFLAAEQNPDARESARALIGRDGGDLLRSALIETVRDLATERFDSILARGERLKNARPPDDTSRSESAVQALYGLCWAAILQVVARLVGRAIPETEFQRFDTAQAAFDEVVRLATAEVLPGDHPLVSTYAGPRHLARLLKRASDGLVGSSITDVPTPGGADPAFWLNWLRHRALSKPVLWRSHRAAIATGFLDAGRSAVLVLPTGAGKTTLSELKIAATLATGRKGIFLVPTLALVDQLRDELAEAFPSALVGGTVSLDGDLTGVFTSELNSIEVMTPERCLALLSHSPDALDETGLLVFDECHLLSPTGGGKRSLDAMLCLLHSLIRAPHADLLLLSAMLTNATDFSAWIQEFTGRPCVSFQDPWKPSRQARGVVVYPKTDLDRIVQQMRSAASSHGRKRPSLQVLPYALFGLQQNWSATATTDRRLVRLTDDPVTLAASSSVARLTPNANSVAAEIAVQAARTKLKTIIFVQQASHAVSTARKIADVLPSDLALTSAEAALWDAIQAELGGAAHSLVQPGDAALAHNGDMLAIERRLAEALFRKAEGANVIVATPTLAQGMNLPAQLVILASDKRFEADSRVTLQAHEIMNAAGRAGRAGHLANGVVLLVPEPIVTFAKDGHPDPLAFEKLRTVLPPNDLCVRIDDPLTLVLDRIQGGHLDDRETDYFLSRLRAAILPDDPPDVAVAIASRSFAAYIARKNHQEAAFNEKLESLRLALLGDAGVDPDIELTAAATGLPRSVLAAISARLEQSIDALPREICVWSDWMVTFLREDPTSCSRLFGVDALMLMSIVRGRRTDEHPTTEDFERLRLALRSWLSGQPLHDIEVALGVPNDKVTWCPRARDLVLKVTNRTLYLLAAAVTKIAKGLASRHGAEIQEAVIDSLAIAFRKGLDSPAKVAFSTLKPQILTRVLVHQSFAQAIGNPPELTDEDYDTVVATVETMLLFGAAP